MGPVISPASKTRIERSIATGIESGGQALLDGRGARVRMARQFPAAHRVDRARIRITLWPPPRSSARFSPWNQPGIWTTPSRPYRKIPTETRPRSSPPAALAARKFRYEVPTGNVGVNIGVAAPMAYFPFSGWKDSFLGVLHGQGRDAVEFYTDKKVVDRALAQRVVAQVLKSMSRSFGGVMAVSFLRLIAVAAILVSSASAQSGSAPGDWPSYGGDKGFKRYSPLDQINRDNAKKLVIVWGRPAVDPLIKDKFPDLGPSNYFRGTPIMIEWRPLCAGWRRVGRSI